MRIKETGEIVRVINTEMEEEQVMIHAQSRTGYTILSHKEIE